MSQGVQDLLQTMQSPCVPWIGLERLNQWLRGLGWTACSLSEHSFAWMWRSPNERNPKLTGPSLVEHSLEVAG